MANLVLTSVGTTGDVVPYLALSRGLMARGHRVRLVSHNMHQRLIEKRGVEFVPDGLASDVAVLNKILDEAAKVKEPLIQFETFVLRFLLLSAERRYKTHLATGQGADLVIAHGFDFLAQEAAIKNQVPWASVTLIPHLIPTNEAPVYPLPRLGKRWAEKTWKTLYELSQVSNRKVTAILAQFGAPWRSLGVAGAVSPLLHLIAASSHLTHRRSDWPAHMHLTGAWLEAPSDFTPEPTLVDFLEEHPRPIVVTFGSMGGGDGQRTSEMIAEALAQVDRPAIIQGGYSGISASADRVLSVGYVPHDYLFSRASCVVHHAGAGTSTAASRFGAPSVVVPHLFDQYYWAGMLHERGLAPKPMFRNEMTPKRLARRLKEALAEKYQRAAREIAPKIETEGGVERAIALIEGALKGA